MQKKLLIILSLSLTLTLNPALMAQGYVCAVGGGSEDYNDWSDAPYSWIVQKSDSGRVIILGTSVSVSNWLPDYFMSLGADTAYNRTISAVSDADLQSTYNELITAGAIFIRGGDQWNYIRLWKGTKTDSAIQYVFNKGGVIAGTSAGAAVLGQVDFSARFGSAYPDEALQNPFYNRMQFEDKFLNFVPDVLFDTHFIERGRHGRLVAMLYNQHFNADRNLIGVGIDDRTALCISPDGIGEVMGSGAITVYYKDNMTRYSQYAAGRYTIENMSSHILTRGWKYSFIENEIHFIPPSALDFGMYSQLEYPRTGFTLTGSDNISSHLYNLSSFLEETDNSNILILSHPGFTDSISALTDYLATNNYSFELLNITAENLNDLSEAEKINNASCFIIAGDSLNVLSYINQPGVALNSAFYNSLSQQIPAFFFGSAGKAAGDQYIWNTDTDFYASYRGKMTIKAGLNVFGDMIFQPLIFDDPDYYENRMSAVLWGMMRSRSRIGIYLNGDDRLKIKSAENTISGNVQIPYIIIDARETNQIDSSSYRASGSIGPRQVVAMNNLRVSITNYQDINYLIGTGKFDNLMVTEEDPNTLRPNDFVLYQNYPNPFNSVTKISWQSPVGGRQTLKVYDILGNEITTLVDEYREAGRYEVEFQSAVISRQSASRPGSALTSGIYFYRLSAPEYSNTKSMVLIK